MYLNNGTMLIDYKSDEKANKFREAGNNEFIKKKFFDALIFYNTSICYASTKYVLSLGYANRSAVYLEIDCYDECLKNIEWARENEYPADKLSKLEDRERKCKKLMSEGNKYLFEDPWNLFKLSYPANKKIPWIVECLEVRTTEKFGRGIYATKDLKAGDIISIEEPVMHLGFTSIYYQHCTACFKTCLLNLIPCSQTATLMFCSTACMDNLRLKASNMNLPRVEDMNFLSEVAAPFGGYKQLDSFINKKDLEDLKMTIFDYDLSNPEDPNYRKNLMTCFLSSHSKDFLAKGLIVSDKVSKKSIKHLSNLFLADNFYIEDYFGLRICDCFYTSTFRSLLNHSCLNNVKFISIDNKSVGIVARPIKAGEQLFECYFDKTSTKHAEYKKEMMQYLKFKCDCQECLDDSYKYYEYDVPFPYLSMSRKNFTKAKEYLKKCWQKLNTSKDPRELEAAEAQSFVFMGVLAYYVTYPYHQRSESDLEGM